jgi:adenylosuccinate lyase
MKNDKSKYISPLLSRYASDEMLYVFSEEFKFTTWRELWIALAKAEQKLGLPITNAQIKELEKFRSEVNFIAALRFEKETRHDVMAHVRAYGKQCPKAASIIHLGATSAYVGDNTDLIQLRAACQLVRCGLARAIKALSVFAKKHADTPCLGYTHFQPAQPVTMGKRACLWIQDLLFDLHDLESFETDLKFLGVKGTTGTQASFLKLFGGNAAKVRKLDEMITRRMGFKGSFPVTGQTYPRKIDSKASAVLGGIAESCHKFAGDLRLLQHLKEAEEPFEKNQIGSSAMAYKRNPMRSERICSLARFVMSLAGSTSFTAATQWFERTLDDSANKRMAIPEAFLAVDAMLIIFQNIAEGIVVNKQVVGRRLLEETSFMATENILMEATKRGGNRQDLHEKIRKLSMEARQETIETGSCGLLQKIAADPAFGLSEREIKELARPEQFTGLSKEQTLGFIKEHVTPRLRAYTGLSRRTAELKV